MTLTIEERRFMILSALHMSDADLFGNQYLTHCALIDAYENDRGISRFDDLTIIQTILRVEIGTRGLVRTFQQFIEINGYLMCQSCGRTYPMHENDPVRLSQSCPADDCPSRWEEIGVQHPMFNDRSV